MATNTNPVDNESTKTETPKPLNIKPAKKSNKTLFIILGVVATLLIIVPVVLSYVFFNFVKNKVSDDTTSSTIAGLVEKASDGKVNVDTSKGEITIKGENGDQITNKKTLPDGFPSVVVIYTPSTIQGSYKTTTDNKTNWTVALESSDSVTKVNDSIKNSFAGWTKSGEYSSDNSSVINYTNDTYTVVVTTGQSSIADKTSILYSVSQK